MDEQSLGDHLAGPEGLTERSNTFDERAVLQEFAAAASAGRPGRARCAGRPSGSPSVADVIATRSCGEMTTAELVECERRLIAAAVGRAGEGAGVVDAVAR